MLYSRSLLVIILYIAPSSVQSLSCVRLFVTPWITARQASLSITNSRSLLKLISIESIMPSSHLILCHPLLLLPPIPPSIRVFSNESTLPWGGQSIGVSASASVLPTNTQDCSPINPRPLIYPFPLSPLETTSVFSMSVGLFLSCIWVHLYHSFFFWFHI